MNLSLSLCDCHVPRRPRLDLLDARKGRDPTRTYFLRARMRGEGDRRWSNFGRTLREAVAKEDVVGLRGIGKLNHTDKTGGFSAWVRNEINNKVFGHDGSWTKAYVDEAADVARKWAAELAPRGADDPRRVTSMESLAVSELRGVCEAAQVKIVRVVTHAVMAGDNPYKVANDVAKVIREMRNRTRAMSEYVVSKTSAVVSLSFFRGAGISHVGVVPERVRRKKVGDAALDARRRQGPGSRLKGRAPSASTIGRIIAAQANIEEEVGETVEVLTAEDDDVCPQCQDIADGGPYDLATAEGLIPAHNYCRCAFAPAAVYGDSGPEDEPRDPHGRWTSGGGSAASGGKRIGDFDPDEPRDPHGMWTSGAGGKLAAAKEKVRSFITSPEVKSAVKTVAHKLDENKREILAAAITFSLYHLVKLDFPVEVEEAVHAQVVHFAENASVAVGEARDLMKKSVDAMISLRSKVKADAYDADEVMTALVRLRSILERMKVR